MSRATNQGTGRDTHDRALDDTTTPRPSRRRSARPQARAPAVDEKRTKATAADNRRRRGRVVKAPFLVHDMRVSRLNREQGGRQGHMSPRTSKRVVALSPFLESEKGGRKLEHSLGTSRDVAGGRRSYRTAREDSRNREHRRRGVIVCPEG